MLSDDDQTAYDINNYILSTFDDIIMNKCSIHCYHVFVIVFKEHYEFLSPHKLAVLWRDKFFRILLLCSI